MSETSAPRSLLDRAALLTASLLGAGRSPIAPGTVGTLATIPLYLVLVRYTGPIVYVAATLALLIIGVFASTRAGRLLGLHDPGFVVIDEAVGFLVTMTFIQPGVTSLLLGFIAFRLLDTLKPIGIDRLEHLPEGLGIMMDDFAAGVVGNVLVRLALELPQALP